MTSDVKKNLGSSLTAASLAILGLSATLAPLGVGKAGLIAVAVSGGVVGVVGIFFSHLYKNDQDAAIAQGAAIDAGKVPTATVTLTASTPPAGSLAGTLTNAQPPIPTTKP